MPFTIGSGATPAVPSIGQGARPTSSSFSVPIGQGARPSAPSFSVPIGSGARPTTTSTSRPFTIDIGGSSHHHHNSHHHHDSHHHHHSQEACKNPFATCVIFGVFATGVFILVILAVTTDIFDDYDWNY